MKIAWTYMNDFTQFRCNIIYNIITLWFSIKLMKWHIIVFYQSKSFLVQRVSERVCVIAKTIIYCIAAKREEVERWLNRPQLQTNSMSEKEVFLVK